MDTIQKNMQLQEEYLINDLEALWKNLNYRDKSRKRIRTWEPGLE